MKDVLILVPAAAILSAALLCIGAEPTEETIEGVDQSELVLHYTFDDHTGEVIANELGTTHSGRSRDAVFANARSAGTALFIRKNNATSGYVEVPDHADLNAPTFTVAAWIKLRREDSSGSVVCKHDWPDGTARGYVLRCYTADFVNLTIGAGGWVRANGTTRVPANQWVHVAGSFDGTHLRAFFNGRLEGTTEVRQPYTPSPLPLRVGHAAYKLERPRKFDGQIDDVMIWKQALSEEELRAVYDSQKKSRPRPLSAADIAPLIKKLGAAAYKDRTLAQRKLIEFDTEVLPLLKPHRRNGDLEVVWRIRQIERAIGADASD